MDAVGSEEGELVSNGVAKEKPELEELISLDQSVDFDLKDMSESEARPDSVAEGGGHKQTSEQENSSCQQLRMCCASPRLTAMRQFWFVKEAVHLTRLAVPLSLLGFMQQLFFFIILPMVGHRLGPTELDAVALAQSFSAVTGRSLIVGLSSAADTLCTQSYGYKNYKRVGIVFQRGVFILGTVIFTVIAIWMVSDSIFLLLQQDICVVQISAKFLRLRALGLPFYLVYIMLVRYLQAQSLVWIFVAIGFIQNVVGIAFNSLFLYATNLGVVGVALSMMIFDALSPILLIAYIKGRGLHKKTWGGWSWDSLRGWSQFLKYGVAGYLMLAFEWWSFEITTLVTGSISKNHLAANVVIFQLSTIAYMIPFGFGTAAAVRVGNELGAGNPRAAKRAAFTGVAIEAVIAVVINIFILGTRNFIGRIFTTDEDVLEILAPALLVSLLLFATDQIQGVISGVLRGAGKQVLGAVVNFFCYYIIGLPLGICLTLLTELGIVGIWIGIGVADTLQTLVYFICLLKFDWSKLSEQAVRNAGGKVETEKEEDGDNKVNHEQEVEMEVKREEREARESISSSEEDSCLDESDNEEVESTAPLISDGEKEEEIVEDKNIDCREVRLTKRHKLRLLLSKGSVVVVSCSLLLVGVVLGGVLHHDYSSCDPDQVSCLLVSSLLPTAAVFYSTPCSLSSASRTPLATPTPTSTYGYRPT